MDSTQSAPSEHTTPKPQSKEQPQCQPQYQDKSEPKRKWKRIMMGLGIGEIVIGVISIAFAVAATVDGSNRRKFYKIGGQYYSFRFDPSDKCSDTRNWSYISQGVWCGSLTLITGILGIVLVKKTSTRLCVGNIVMAIVTALTVVAGVVLSGLIAAFSESCAGLLVGIQVVIAIVCFLAMVLTILHAALCWYNRVRLEEDPEKPRQSRKEQPQEAYYDSIDEEAQPTSIPTRSDPNQRNVPIYENPIDSKDEDQAGVVIYDEKL